MSKAWEPYALHILDAIDKIERIQSRGNFLEDDILYDAVLRNLQTLSEATQRLPDDLKIPFDRIPWRQISGFRNILVHDYLGEIDSNTVNQIVQDFLPELEQVVRAMLGPSGLET